jgi:hypothetical protein
MDFNIAIRGLTSMDHLVILDAQAGGLEKILSGAKTMLVRDFDPSQSSVDKVQPGDILYFLRNDGECIVRVKATTIRVFVLENDLDERLSQFLKEMQPKLHLTEDQYNTWTKKNRALFIEFNLAHKIPLIQIALDKITDTPGWVSTDDISLISE